MRKSIYRIISLLIMLMVMTFAFCGCSLGPSVSLTEEESDIIAEYAAGLLVKYNKGHSMGIVRVNDLNYELLYATPTPTPIPTPEPEIVVNSEDGIVEDVNNEKGGKSAKEIEEATLPMNEAFGLNDSELSYVFYETCDSYPTGGDELVFSMNATSGNDLLILHFNVSNPTGASKNVSTNLGNRKIRALINGTDRVRCEVTILTNDLSSFSGEVGAGSGVDEVLVFEVPEGTPINSLELLLVSGDGTLKYKLF